MAAADCWYPEACSTPAHPSQATLTLAVKQLGCSCSTVLACALHCSHLSIGALANLLVLDVAALNAATASKQVIAGTDIRQFHTPALVCSKAVKLQLSMPTAPWQPCACLQALTSAQIAQLIAQAAACSLLHKAGATCMAHHQAQVLQAQEQEYSGLVLTLPSAPPATLAGVCTIDLLLCHERAFLF